ncbi:DoxX family protein [Altererythrobacter arenosus]|uniref:DoxX family protein n=1 Tax=Altererythrobacter arenosus TaxID=3032592 RepID=A0ABY8FM17_9SPHN|nr:DoxX family protein [Altererythrobacter sp. CAU 1644]WFL76059.1 DoxX family protein [Altererythrobacter sp. CAU 1644]
MKEWLNPNVPVGAQDLTLAALRVLTGSFLIYGTWDNIVSPARMQEFVDFLTAFGFPEPQLLAPLSVWVQFISGVLLVLGLFTRWAGVLVFANFVVAVVMVHWAEDFRGWWPAIVLVFLGAHFAAAGAGPFGMDRFLPNRKEGG